MCDDLFNRTIQPTKACLEDAELDLNEINELVLVGGTDTDAKVVETAHSLVSKKPNQGVNPDEVVAIGAAIGVVF